MTKRRHDRPSAGRTRFVVGSLLALALWPLVHRLGVAAYEWNPWKLGGFAMYATHTTSLVVLLEPAEGAWRPIDEAGLAPPVREALSEFRRQRDALGRLREPRDVAGLAFQMDPEREHLLVTVQRLHLEPSTGRIGSRKAQYFYERRDFGR